MQHISMVVFTLISRIALTELTGIMTATAHRQDLDPNSQVNYLQKSLKMAQDGAVNNARHPDSRVKGGKTTWDALFNDPQDPCYTMRWSNLIHMHVHSLPLHQRLLILKSRGKGVSAKTLTSDGGIRGLFFSF